MRCEIAVAEGKVCKAKPTPRMLEIAARVRELSSENQAEFNRAYETFRHHSTQDMVYLLRALGVVP